MKVLHLPYNIGSKITLTVAAQRKINIEAKGIAVNNYLDEAGENVEVFNTKDYNYLNPKKYFEYTRANREIKQLILWSDVIHWYYDFKIFHSEKFINLIKEFKKPSVVEFLGSDVRIPEILFPQNPYYKKIFSEDYLYKFESLEQSRTVQKKFKDAGFEALVRPELEQFIQKDIFSSYIKINNRIDVKRYTPAYPSSENKKALIVHPVTDRSAKGTLYILDVINSLKKKYNFDLLLIENSEHKNVMQQLSKADIVIDQLILGAFGTISLEGMALGKPTVCFLTDDLQKKLPGIPLVNSNPDSIYSSLESLLVNPSLRNEIGKKSRQYVEENHDSDKIAIQLKNIYEEVLKKKSSNK